MWIAVGAAGGAVLRYLVSGWVQQASGGAFPLGTLVVNVTGCLVIGILAQVAESGGLLSPAMRLLLVTGLLGGYTTYSTFANEAYLLGRSGEMWSGLLYVMLHVLLGLVAVWLGHTLVLWLWRTP
jgi:CrcB protein